MDAAGGRGAGNDGGCRAVVARSTGARSAGPGSMRRRGLALLLALAVVVLPGCSDNPAPTTAPDECSVPEGSKQLDVDREDSPELPWQKPEGQKLMVYFAIGDLDERYTRLSEEAVAYWAASACVDTVAVDECPADANCVTMSEAESAGFRERDTDGAFSGNDRGQYRTGGEITLYTRLLDESSDNGALATIVHEMGHAVGLVHRMDSRDVMNAYTSDRTNPQPDDINFVNLAVIYGTRH